MAYRYLIFHKPYNVLSQFTQGATPPKSGPRKTLADFISTAGVYPVGRLDFDSEGLMLLTDDGALQHRLLEPSFEHPREYWVQVEGAATDSALQQLASGVSIQNYQTRRCQAVRMLDPGLPPRNPPVRTRLHIPTSWISVVLTEGRNRQVRRMTAAVGFPTLRLIRVAIGTLSLGALPAGESRSLTAEELAGLTRQIKVPRKRN